MNNRLRLRVFCVIAAVAIICAFAAGCAQKNDKPQRRDVVKDAFALLSDWIDRGIAESDGDEWYAQNWKAFEGIDFDKPRAVYSLEPDMDSLSRASGVGSSGYGERVNEYIGKLLDSSFLKTAAVGSDVKKSAFASLAQVGVSGYNPEIEENGWYIYFYDSCVIALTVTGESGYCSAVVCPVSCEGVECGSTEDVRAFLAEPDVVKKIEKVK